MTPATLSSNVPNPKDTHATETIISPTRVIEPPPIFIASRERGDVTFRARRQVKMPQTISTTDKISHDRVRGSKKNRPASATHNSSAPTTTKSISFMIRKSCNGCSMEQFSL